jgi:WD40 repeat protein
VLTWTVRPSYLHILLWEFLCCRGDLAVIFSAARYGSKPVRSTNQTITSHPSSKLELPIALLFAPLFHFAYAFCFRIRRVAPYHCKRIHCLLHPLASIFFSRIYTHRNLHSPGPETALTAVSARMDDIPYSLRNRTVGRNTSSSYRDISRIRPSPYPVSAGSSPTRGDNQESPRRLLKARHRLSLSPPKRTPCKSPTHPSDRFIPHSSSPVSLRHLLSSPTHRPQRNGSQSPTNPQLQSPGKEPEWPNSYDDTILSYRLASALEIPLSPKLLLFHSQPASPTRSPTHSPPPDDSLLPSLLDPPALLRRSQRRRIVPPDPFRILDAPDLRDDYYCEPLSWCRNGTLAVALGPDIFLWSRELGVAHLPSDSAEDITSVAFNQTGDILAIAREDGSILLYSPQETIPRIHIAPIASGAIGALAWRPTTLPSIGPILHESLVIGTYDGQVLLCDVAWNLDVFDAKVERRGLWNNIHDDQICGIAWSNDGLSFATGANDNKVCTYEIPMGVIGVNPRWEKKFHWVHEAAVKALAYKSGKGGVLATGSLALFWRVCWI